MRTPKSPLTAILLDDDPSEAYLLGRMLEEADRDVELIHHATPEAAKADLFRGKVDLIFLDHHLADDRTGLELLKELRSSGFQGAVVMLTGSDEASLIDDFQRHGADAYINKADLDQARVLRVIDVALRLPHNLVPDPATDKAWSASGQ